MSWGPAGVFLLAVIDNFGLPMVAGVDTLVVLVAVLDPSRAYWAAAAAILGSMVGSGILFLIARKGGEEYLHRYTAHGRGARLRAWFLEYGLLTVFVPAFVPIPLPLKVFVLSAGALEVPPLRFFLVFTAARVPRYLLFAWLGTRLGRQTLPYLRAHIWELAVFSVALFAVLYWGIKLWHRRHSPTAAK